MKGFLAIAMFAMLCLVAPSDGFAQSDADRAGEHFRLGSDLYFAGEYAQAIVEFEKANALAPDVLVLYNIVLAHHKLGNVDAALAVARVAGTMGGLKPKEQTNNAARIAAFGRVLGARIVAKRSEREAPAVVATTPESTVTADPAPPGRTLRTVGLSLIATGGAGLVAALVMERVASATVNRFEEAQADGDDTAFLEERDRLERQQGVGRVLFYTGLGLAAVGGVLIVVDLTRPAETALTLGSSGAAVRVIF